MSEWRKVAKRLLKGDSPPGRRESPTYWKHYLAQQLTSTKKKLALENVHFVVIDTETTGLDYSKDRVVSFGGVHLKNNSIDISSAVEWKIRADLPSEPISIEIHGLLNQELASGISEDRFIEILTRYIGNAIIVGYRPGFDMAILNRMTKERTGGKLSNAVVDVFQLAMRLDFPLKPNFVPPEKYSFDSLCRRLNVETVGRHTALGDAYATAELFLKILNRLKQQGLSTLGDLLRSY